MPRQNGIVALAVAAQVAISLVQFGLPALTFALAHDRGIGPGRFGVLFAAVGLGSAIALLGAGRACDRLGARPVLVVGSMLGGSGLLACGVAADFRIDVAALLLAGVGNAAVPVAGMTAILARFPPERRGRLLGLRQMAVPAGGFVAAGLLPALHGIGGLALAFAVPAVLVWVLGGAFAIVVGRTDAQASRPPPFRSAFGRPVIIVMLTSALYVAALGGVLAFSTGAAHAAGLTEREAGVVFATLNVAAAVARLTWGLVADGGGGTRERRVRTLRHVGLLGTVAALLFPLALHAGIGLAIPAAVLVGFGTLGFNGLVYLLAGELAPPGTAGVTVGATAAVTFAVGALVGPPFGLLVEHAGYGAVFVLVAALTLAGSLVARGLRPAVAAGVSR